MHILFDMNMSPEWVKALNVHGFTCVHWSAVGPVTATDAVIFKWAAEHKYIVFTHDLDFGAILAATNARFPSVIQLRSQYFFPDDSQHTLLIIYYIRQYEVLLSNGALLTIDESSSKVRVLPLNPESK